MKYSKGIYMLLQWKDAVEKLLSIEPAEIESLLEQVIDINSFVTIPPLKSTELVGDLESYMKKQNRVKEIENKIESEWETKADIKRLYEYINSLSLTEEESKRLMAAIEEDYMDIPNRRQRYKEMRKNKWFNALQVKFAYALTCHKTQGGQWNNVFIDSSMNLKETLEVEDLRWVYTALTRAQDKVYFVNFKEEFFG